ncbi:hypothetical protein GCM10025863_10180 [Microbacterium suwonense]|uniref:Uncharacterized protein n=1 Tax=Microbacterium suwonense TaxID=683047 RepID=A0ABN6X158_9MICO|nr:hypothetical protein GCM10025863_10180 [Microbacterium suwonense]
MKAWLSDTAYDRVTLTKSGNPKTAHVDAQLPPAEGGETSGRSPVGSDLWLDSFADQDALVAEMQLPEGNGVLIARDGVQPAPSNILVSWALDTRTPWAGPLMVAGEFSSRRASCSTSLASAISVVVGGRVGRGRVRCPRPSRSRCPSMPRSPESRMPIRDAHSAPCHPGGVWLSPCPRWR